MCYEAKAELYDPKNMRCPPNAHRNLKNLHHQPLRFSLDMQNVKKKTKRENISMIST